MDRYIKIERAILVGGQHAEVGSVIAVDPDTANRLIRHHAAVEAEASESADAEDAPADSEQTAPAPKK